jgi:hypothetical protein
MFQRTSRSKDRLLAGFLVSGILVATAGAQTQAAVAKPAVAKKPAVAAQPIRYQPSRFPKRAELHYGVVWGVDSLAVKWTESGEIIKFTYRVLDPAKAQELNNKKAEPTLIDPRAGVKLSVPALEKIGQLRQTGSPVAGTAYWMAFSNVGRVVKRGDHVSVVIGNFRADGLVVD